MRSFFRYPGGKYKLMSEILFHIGKKLDHLEYREPFFGGGSVGINVIHTFKPKRVWINDYDVALSDLWNLVINEPELLIGVSVDFIPSIKSFYEFKRLLSTDDVSLSSAERGFMKLAIHQMSYSGLGVKAGGPIGGKTQKSQYAVGCRWSPKNITKKVRQIHNLFSATTLIHGKCTSDDYSVLIESPGNAFIYLDPPYYDQGQILYQHGFEIKQHEDMRDMLKSSSHKWVLSYDDHPAIIDLYQGWSEILRIDRVNYSITAVRNKESGEINSRSKSELLIIS